MSDEQNASKELSPTLEQLREYTYRLKMWPRGDQIIPVQLLDVMRKQIETAWSLLRAAPEPSIAPVTAIDQYRCQPEKQTYCPHMDSAHGLLAEWLIAWDRGEDTADTYCRTHELLQAALTKCEHGVASEKWCAECSWGPGSASTNSASS